MGIIWQGILGGVSGRVGNVIGSSWKGIPVLKSRPLSVANPRTTQQVHFRDRLTKLVAIASVINSSIIIPLWNRFASRMSGYNAFIQANSDAFNSSLAFVPASFSISRGRMASTAIISADIQTVNTECLVSYSPSITDSFQTAYDVPFVVITSSTGVLKGFKAGDNARSDASELVFSIPGTSFAVGDICFLAFRRQDGSVVSNTSFKALIA